MAVEVDRAFELQLRGYRLATMEIIYHLPDHPGVLQSFIWQHYDRVPEFPETRRFLDFWTRHIEGKLHSVYLTHAELIAPGRWSHVRHEFRIH
ncbi:MAG TPA: hypothetical protein ENJ38_01490 [Rhodospirillales bacterium]|nr:hypothetical protein [Rhodospirillales bacterium]